MDERHYPVPTSIALVAMFFLLLVSKVVTVYYVSLLGKDILHSKTLIIESHSDIEVMKNKIDALESFNEKLPPKGDLEYTWKQQSSGQ